MSQINITKPAANVKFLNILERSRLSKRAIQPRPMPEHIKRIVRSQIFERFLQLLTLSDKRREQLRGIGLNDEIIDFLLIRDCPALLVNLEACSNIVAEFGDISDCAGFYRTEFANFRFDVGEHLASISLLCAERDAGGLIVSIRLFRGFADDGFRVRVRKAVA